MFIATISTIMSLILCDNKKGT